jgi:hypothetical protein
MNKNPYINNPVAKQLLESYYERLFENENVDELLVKISDNALNAFKILNFDLAPKRDRNPDVIRVKLSDIANSKTVKSLTAKLIDYAKDNDLVNSKFAESKRLYLESLGKFAEALDRSSEIAKGKDEVIIKQFKLCCTKLQNSIDAIAKQAEQEAKNESFDSDFDSTESLNENIFTGYQDRVVHLKKNLTNLITSAEGKDQKNGYGRDWKRTFIDLDEKRKALDKAEGGDKNRKALEDLEKQVEKFQEEFNNALVQTANRSLQKLEDDEEVYTTYSDVTNLVSQGLDLLTRAKTQYGLAVKEIREDSEMKETEMAKALFPIKRGDIDSAKKFKNSGLIAAIQKALMDGIPAASKLMKSKGGADGKYGIATASVVSTIQKISGNKNTNGDIDKTLLSDIMSSDWVSAEDSKAIQKSLDTVKAKMNESQNSVLSLSDYLKNSVNEGKIVINQSEFEKELNTQYKAASAAAPASATEFDHHKGSTSSSVSKLSKNLRQKYSIKVEAEDFTKHDGSLKASYSPEFIKEWNQALEKADPAEEYSYFFAKGGVYNINLGTTSLKTPCNFVKWTESRQIKELGNEDAVDFMRNYLKGWTTFGMIRPEWRYEGIKTLLNKNSDNDSLDLSGAFELMESCVKNKEIPFIDYENLKGDIAKAFNLVLQKGEKSPDLGKEEFVAINNFLVMIANCVTFDGSKFVSCIKWIHDNVLGESTAKRIANDNIYISDTDDKDTGLLLTYQSSKIISGHFNELEKSRNTSKRQMSGDLPGFSILGGARKTKEGIKKMLGENIYYIAADI